MIVGASFDPVDANCAFAQKFSYPYKLVSDVSKDVGKAYDAYDPNQPDYPRRISYLIGPDGRVKRAYTKVSPKDHPAQVLGDLAALRSG